MKKVIFVVAAAVPFIAAAQMSQPLVFDNLGVASVIPPTLSGEDKVLVAVVGQVDNSYSTFEIYDENFTKLKSFEADSPIIHTGTVNESLDESGKWQTSDEREISEMAPAKFTYSYSDGVTVYNYEDMVVSKSLFGNGNMFEYIMPDAEITTRTEEYSFSGDKVDARITYYEATITGFHIKNESGNVVRSIKFPEGYSKSYNRGELTRCTLFNLKGKLYLSTVVSKYDEENGWYNDYTIVLSVDKSSSDVHTVMIKELPSKGMRASVAGKTLMVSLPQDCAATGISLFDMSGRRVLTAAADTAIDCSALASGAYIVRADGTPVKNSCKIVIN